MGIYLLITVLRRVFRTKSMYFFEKNRIKIVSHYPHSEKRNLKSHGVIQSLKMFLTLTLIGNILDYSFEDV